MARVFALFAILVFAGGCQTTSETVKKYPVGSVVSDVILQGEKRIPLPPGNWKILTSHIDNPLRGINPFNSLILANLNEKAAVFGIWIATDVASSPRYMATRLPEKCRSGSAALHYFNPMPLGEMNQKCWFVDIISRGHKPFWKKSLSNANNYAERNGVSFPIKKGEYGMVSYQLATPEHFLFVMLFFQEQNHLASLDLKSVPVELRQAALKEIFRDKLVEFGKEYFVKVQQGFNHAL